MKYHLLVGSPVWFILHYLAHPDISFLLKDWRRWRHAEIWNLANCAEFSTWDFSTKRSFCKELQTILWVVSCLLPAKSKGGQGWMQGNASKEVHSGPVSSSTHNFYFFPWCNGSLILVRDLSFLTVLSNQRDILLFSCRNIFIFFLYL